jgi:hypothetical protein
MPFVIPSDDELKELARLGDALYNRLSEELKAQNPGSFVAIHVDSGDYAIADTSANAGRALLKRHPIDGRIHIRRISSEPEYGLSARIGPGRSGSVSDSP